MTGWWNLGAVWAINLDGGGSSTSWLGDNLGVQGCPTFNDMPCCCSRSVTTISCIYSTFYRERSSRKHSI